MLKLHSTKINNSHLLYWLHINSIDFNRFRGVQSHLDVLWKVGVLEIEKKSSKNTCKGIHILIKFKALCQQLYNNGLFFKGFTCILRNLPSFIVCKISRTVISQNTYHYLFLNCKFDSYFYRTSWPCMVCHYRKYRFWVNARNPFYSRPPWRFIKGGIGNGFIVSPETIDIKLSFFIWNNYNHFNLRKLSFCHFQNLSVILNRYIRLKRKKNTL